MSGEVVQLAPPPSRRLRLVSFKPMIKGRLRGFCTIELPPGLILSDLPVLIGNDGRPWVALPSKPVLDAKGQAKRDSNGRIEYQPIGKWTSRPLSDQFSARLVGLIDEQYPGALTS
jgi:DNA-binding cell septation regulator SpoVG